MPHYPDDIEYSDKYEDDTYEYRHVILPRAHAKRMQRMLQTGGFPGETPGTTLLTEPEWRDLGVTQSRGWQHYEVHRPEPHILLFRRPLGTNPVTGQVNPVKPVAEGQTVS
mmetsp:Transcript_80550/g.215049  ORF Transcript_80550/g.215049 Transcript_80550/m.215049 type:complete len:111 (+) Transcript_80550:63-395(+)